MTVEVLRDLDEGEALRAAGRSRAWLWFVTALDYPVDEALCDIREGRLADALAETLQALDPRLLEGLDLEALRDAGSGDDLAVEYTRLFDLGTSGPPCPLYGGLYGDARMKTMEEAVRFYNHFGLSRVEERGELPDHLTTELEFLHYLAFREAQALRDGGDAGPYRRAQRDFIERHPGRWVPELRKRLESNEALPFFQTYARALERLLAAAHRELADS
ncbi:MAG: molecular chaperone TorD family protein [Myxococcota bacterium]